MSKAKFTLGDYLSAENVSTVDTSLEQIVLLPLDQIDPDPDNFYSLDGIEELAGNIETVGLLDPLRVRENGKRFTVVSGHRRRAACMLIRDGGNPMFDKGVPSIIERGDVSRELQELRLIFANSSTRVLTGAELSKQAERVAYLLNALKWKGLKLPGRMRDHVAAATNSSSSRIGRLHAIRERLIPVLLQKFDEGLIGETAAYRLSRESAEMQDLIWRSVGVSICGIDVQSVDHVIGQVAKEKAEADARPADSPKAAVEKEPSSPPPSQYSGSFDAEKYLAERAAEDRAFFEMLNEEADPFLRQLGTVNSRQEGIQMLKECLGREHSGWLYDRVDVNCSPKGVRLWDANGDSDADITRTWTDVYDMLCTIALTRAAVGIGRAEPEGEEDGDPSPAGAGAPLARGAMEPEWMSGDPEADGWYCCWAVWEPESKKWDPDREFLYWRGCSWFDNDRDADRCIPAQYEVHKWYRIPDDPEAADHAGGRQKAL